MGLIEIGPAYKICHIGDFYRLFFFFDIPMFDEPVLAWMIHSTSTSEIPFEKNRYTP